MGIYRIEAYVNSSSLAARATASSRGTIHDAALSFSNAWFGKLHGNAIDDVVHLFIDYKTPEDAEKGIMERLRKRERISGYGHWFLKQADPRNEYFSAWNDKLAEAFPETSHILPIREKVS